MTRRFSPRTTNSSGAVSVLHRSEGAQLPQVKMEQLREELLRVVRCLAEQSMGPEQLSNTAEQLEYFSGENDSLSAEEWLARFEISKQIGRWSEERTRMVLLVKLTSAARLWHLREGAYAHKFDDWKEQFLQMFSEPVRVKRLVEDLEQRVDRSKDDPLQRYVWRAAALAVAMGMSAPDAKSLILNGLPQHDKFFRDELQNRESSNYNDLVRDIEKTLKFKREMPTTRGGKPMAQSPSQIVSVCSENGKNLTVPHHVG